MEFRKQNIILFILVGFLINLLLTSHLKAQTDELDKLLELNLEQLSDVRIVSASKTLQRISEVPATVKVITAQQIQNFGYLTLEDALASLPGFQFRNILGFNTYTFQRGAPNQNNLTLLLLDGIQINELNSGGFYGGGQFNLDNVERIEVVYGPVSALYGTNAISGIINIITKTPKDFQGPSAGITYGTFNTLNVNAGYGYFDETNNFGFRIAGMYKSSEKADLAGADGDFNWSDNMENFEDDYSFDARLQYKNLFVGVNYQDKQSSRTTNYKAIGTAYADRGTEWNIHFLNTYLKFDHNISNKINLQSRAYYRNATVLDNTIAYILDTTQVGYYRPNNLIGAEGIISYKPSGKLNLIGGLVFEYESLAKAFSITQSNSSSEKPPAPPTPDKTNNTLLSAYAQVQYKILPTIKVIGGVRFDMSSYYDNVLTPTVGMIYNEGIITAKIIYAEAFRAPKPWDYTSGIGNDNLEPEEIKSLEFAGTVKLDDNLQLDVSIYNNKLDKKLSTESVGTSFRWINKGELKVKGIELCTSWKSKTVSSYVNYTYNYSTDEHSAISHEIAKHSAGVGLSINLLDDFICSFSGNYFGKRKNPVVVSATGSEYIDNALVFNSSLSYHLRQDLKVQLTVFNIFDKTYYHTSNRPPERYRQPQRSFLVKLSYGL